MIDCATYDCRGRVVYSGDRLISPYYNDDYQIVIIDINRHNICCCDINLNVIRVMAFFNWINAGRPLGNEMDFWFKAEQDFIKSSGFFYISKRNLVLSRLRKF
jgi:hypothetical protein